MFDYIQALNDLGDSNDYNDGLDGWFDFVITHDPDGYTLTATWIPWDEEKGGPGEHMVKCYRLMELAD